MNKALQRQADILITAVMRAVGRQAAILAILHFFDCEGTSHDGPFIEGLRALYNKRWGEKEQG